MKQVSFTHHFSENYFRLDGRLYSASNGPGYVTIVEDAEPFMDTLEFVNFRKGDGSAHAIFKSTTTNRKYHVSITDLDDYMHTMQNGRIYGTWRYRFVGTAVMLQPTKEILHT